MANRGSSQAVKAAEMKRNAQIVELYAQGKSQASIAALVGITQGRVTQIIAQARTEWVARNDIAAGDHIQVSLMKLDEVYQEARSGWERSYQDAVTITDRKAKRKADGDDEGPLGRRLKKADKELQLIYQEEKRVGQSGDPAFLHIMKDVTITRLKLLNAFPKEETNTSVIVQQFDFSQLITPIPCESPIAMTPAEEVEARIEAESNPNPPINNGNDSKNPNSNGNGHA